jgi:hypothetical protein
MVAARRFKSGFLGLWVRSKNGESGRFKMEKVRNALNEKLAEHDYTLLEPRDLSPPFKVKTSIEVDESMNNSEGEDQREVEVKLLFRWELSDEPLPSINDFRYWAQEA